METMSPNDTYTVFPFTLNQVRLLDGPYKEPLERNRAYLRSLDPNRLLHTFRINTGQSHDVTLVPFGSLYGQRYSIYWDIYSGLYSIDYTIPAELTSGKRRVAVIFRVPQKREEVVDDTVGETTVEKNNALRITPRIFSCSMQVSS